MTVPKIFCYEFRTLLEVQREQMFAHASGSVADPYTVRGFAEHSNVTTYEDFAAASAKRNEEQSALAQRELNEIEAALARIGEGTYGLCVDCGEEISRARLKGDPAAKRCNTCETRITSRSPAGD
jgi:DnaK suppressor protein